MLDLNAIWTASSRNSGEYLLGGATSSSFPVQDNPIGSLSGNFVAPQLEVLADEQTRSVKAALSEPVSAPSGL
ncbi:hypothetical protein AB0D57_29275 [Streptomyces sp. NPDC048275]|uniref:hypothetical protein n=1 Tax=Streptomyces sp. NPDC048275 TaxID=3155629 RepID=UPI0033C21C97